MSAKNEAQSAEYERVSILAHEKGHESATEVIPTPMVVGGYNHLTGKTTHYPPVMDGVCGFAEVCFKGTTSWARWAKKNLNVSRGYPTGLRLWIGDYGQSLTRKEAYARAYAKVLCEELGIDAYVKSRMD